MLRIAYFSPLPPQRSGIADYSAELLPHLAKGADVTLFVDDASLVSRYLCKGLAIYDSSQFLSQRWRYDVALYQMGNSMYHAAMYPIMLRCPGITVLHDCGIHTFIVTRTVLQGNFAGYAREMGYALGEEGVHLARRIQRRLCPRPLHQVPLNGRVVDSSLGIIVHSQQAQRQIAAHNPRSPIAVVPAPIGTFSGQLLSRQELGCPDEALVFVSAGQVTGRKQVDLALEAFARLRDDFPQALYVIVGEDRGGGQDLDGDLQLRGLQDTVICTGYVTMQEFISWIAAADVMINLRYPTIGETSATALRGLVAGRPVIVSDHGWCAELPDDVCIKVSPNDVDAVLQAMRRLARDEALRREVGHRAADYARREHSPACAAQRYVDFIESVLSGIIAKVGSLDKQGC